MSKLQLLVATMYQKDFSLAEKMNIQCDAVFANQADTNEFLTKKMPYGNLTMITTATRGVGLNRNIALLAAQGDVILFADDDLTYYDGIADKVVAAFGQNSKADAMVFCIDYTKNGAVVEKRRHKCKRLHVWNSMRYGACVLAVKRECILKNMIFFNQYFGGGCLFSSGEDSLFLKKCFDSGMRIYSNDTVIGSCRKDQSSWFEGCNEKYFYDKGALIGYLFPHTKYVMAVYFGLRCKKGTELAPILRLKLVFKGLKNGAKLIPYSPDVFAK